MNEMWKNIFKGCIKDYESIQYLHNRLILDDEEKAMCEHSLLMNIIATFRSEVED